MSFFKKLLNFLPQKTDSTRDYESTGLRLENLTKPFPFETDQIRIILFRECDKSGRHLLFDSNSIVDLHKDDKTPELHFKFDEKFVKITENYGYQKNTKDFNESFDLSEMIFGTLAMSFCGTTFKVHWLKSPFRMFISHVFLLPFSKQDSTGYLNESQEILLKNLATESNNTPHHLSSTSSYSTEDSGFCSNNTNSLLNSNSSNRDYSTRNEFTCSNDSLEIQKELSEFLSSLNSTDPWNHINRSSDGSLEKRVSRNYLTSLENNNTFSDFIGILNDQSPKTLETKSDNCINQCPKRKHMKSFQSIPDLKCRNNTSGSLLNKPVKVLRKRPKIGFGLCITMTPNHEKEMENFCCEHINLLEAMICRLKSFVTSAFIHQTQFLRIMVNAYRSTKDWIFDFFTATRIPLPIWLEFSLKDNEKLPQIFIKELCWLISFADTKERKFFVSTLLTTILTYHLGWISTVAPFESIDIEISEIIAIENNKLTKIMETYPYNAIWAQMCDLYGAVGYPIRVCRTIVYGTDEKLIVRILNILTYFIRCREVHRKTEYNNLKESPLSSIKNEVLKNNGLKGENFHNICLKRTKTNLDQLILSDDNLDVSNMFLSFKTKTNENKLSYNETIFPVNKNFIEHFPMNLDKSCYGFSNYNNNSKHEAFMDEKNKKSLLSSYVRNLSAENDEPNSKITSITNQANKFSDTNVHCNNTKENSIIFVLGDDEELINLKTDKKNKHKHSITTIDKLKIESLKTESSFEVYELPLLNLEFKTNKSDEIFFPAIFLTVNNHYVADMVLQGITSDPKNWETLLKRDLNISASCSALIPDTMEDISIVANLNEWNIKVLSSSTRLNSSKSDLDDFVCMSSLVSTMLDTIYNMYKIGIPALKCIEYLEKQLQQIYMHSKVLASFLLTTEFCTLDKLTSTLNLSAGDIPLLLAISSVHTPQIMKKYGLSFR